MGHCAILNAFINQESQLDENANLIATFFIFFVSYTSPSRVGHFHAMLGTQVPVVIDKIVDSTT